MVPAAGIPAKNSATALCPAPALVLALCCAPQEFSIAPLSAEPLPPHVLSAELCPASGSIPGAERTARSLAGVVAGKWMCEGAGKAKEPQWDLSLCP